MARKAYKKLYLDACTKLALTTHALAETQERLDDINAAIIPFGEAVVHEIPDGDGSISLDSLQFVSVRAFMEANQRVAFESNGLRMNYAWRGRPIKNIGPKQGL